MSYIRMSQDGQYVNIPGQSRYYIYDNGETIEGWSHEQFAALIGGVVDEIDFPDEQAEGVKHEFINHFGGWNSDYRGGIAPPERAEIFCQCVDSRIGGIELTPDMHRAVRSWVNEFDALRVCDYCGEEFRPYFYDDDTAYCCNEGDCDLRDGAEQNGLTVQQQEKYLSFEEFDDAWDYLINHTTDERLIRKSRE